jgi:hypothetical protein
MNTYISVYITLIWTVVKGFLPDIRGNRILCGEHFAEVVLTPTSFEALGLGAALGGALVPEQIRRIVPCDTIKVSSLAPLSSSSFVPLKEISYAVLPVWTEYGALCSCGKTA